MSGLSAAGSAGRRRVVVRALAAICVVAVSICVVVSDLRASLPGVPSYASVRTAAAPSDARLLDRRGRMLHERRVRSEERRLAWTALDEISPALTQAVIAVEDKRFHDHGGVDLRAVAGALRGRLRGERRGASTLSMQLAGQLDPALRTPRGPRSLRQKLRQIAFALALEQRYSKDQILEAYLNSVSFRGELVGITAAARGLFDKAPHALDAREAWLLAALLRSPNAEAGAVAARACRLVARADAQVDCAALTTLGQSALVGAHALQSPAVLAPHLAARLLGRSGDVRTTLDADLQRTAIRALEEQLSGLRNRNVRDGAVLVVENETGNVLVWVGSSGALSASRHVDFVRARRQAGSTLKPFLYGLAFEDRLITPATLLDDSPIEIPTGLGSYRPDNYDHQFHGPVAARIALGSSLNIPAVRVLERVGVDRAVMTLRAMGIEGLLRADYYGPSLALGAADVTLEELVRAYRALARGGIAGSLRLRADDPPATESRTLGAGASHLVAEILADRGNRSVTFGLESALATRGFAAVKTGTSKDMRDNWCIGFSDRYTVGVWVGNGSGEPMWNVSGVEGASPVWRVVMDALHADDPSVAPEPPDDLVATAAGLVLRGTESAPAPSSAEGRVEDASAPALSRIVSPSPGLVVAYDPDIPPAQQRVLVEALPRNEEFVLVMDGARLGSAGSPVLWPVARGRHRLVLANADGAEVDRVSFVVR